MNAQMLHHKNPTKSAHIQQATGCGCSTTKLILKKIKLVCPQKNIQMTNIYIFHSPSILLSSALWRSGFCCASLLRSSFAHTIKAFIGLRMRASVFARPGPAAGHVSLLVLGSASGLSGLAHAHCLMPGIMTELEPRVWLGSSLA